MPREPSQSKYSCMLIVVGALSPSRKPSQRNVGPTTMLGLLPYGSAGYGQADGGAPPLPGAPAAPPQDAMQAVLSPVAQKHVEKQSAQSSQLPGTHWLALAPPAP